MELKEISVPVEATEVAVLKPTTVIANTISKDYFKSLELKELCKIIESDLKEYESKIQLLSSLISENTKIKADYKRRNKINFTNSESLLQAKNELYKYKSELKSTYLAGEKALKLKKLKYKRIISSYESSWQKALKEFNESSLAMEFHALEKENSLLEIAIKKQEKLNSCTEKELSELKECIQTAFVKKILEFSEAVIEHKKFSDLQKRNNEFASLKLPENSQQIFEFTLFGKTLTLTDKNSEIHDEANCFFSGDLIDVSVFDDVAVPSENLESLNLEEDSICSTPQSKEQLSDASKDQEEDIEFLNSQKNYEQIEAQKINKSLQGFGEKPLQNAKAPITDEKESQYFQLKPSECSKLAQKLECSVEKIKSENIPSEVPWQSAQENEEGFHEEERHLEYEESLSEGSSENQFGAQREIYDRHYRKMSSVSSDEFPPSCVENTNGEPESPSKLRKGNNNSFKPNGTEKNDLKAFTGFFTMEKERNSPKPSIFKLF